MHNKVIALRIPITLSVTQTKKQRTVSFQLLRKAVRQDPSIYFFKKLALLNLSVEYAFQEMPNKNILVRTDYKNAEVAVDSGKVLTGSTNIHLHPNNVNIPSYADFKSAKESKTYEAVFTKKGITIYTGLSFKQHFFSSNKYQKTYTWEGLRERFGANANIFEVIRTLTAENFPEWDTEVKEAKQAIEDKRQKYLEQRKKP